MESAQLTPPQLERLRLTIVRQHNYLTRLRDRIGKLSFPDSDPLTQAVRAADAAHAELYAVVRELQHLAEQPKWAGGNKMPDRKPRDPRARRM